MVVIGVDLGGTSLRVALIDDGSIRERADATGQPMRTGDGEAIATMIADAARPLLLRSRTVRADALVVGAAGAGREAERFELQSALETQRIAWRVIVTTDAELARAAAFEGAPGVLLISGTGSIAVARDTDGTDRRVGGLGWRMGDQGSAYWIAQQGLRAVGAMHDGLGTVTHLAEALCTAASVAGIAGLIQWSTRATVADVAALSPAVLGCASDGDPVAIDIRQEAVRELVDLAVVAGAPRLPVALSGGLLGASGPLRQPIIEAIEAMGGSVQRRTIDPCRGAPHIARGES